MSYPFIKYKQFANGKTITNSVQTNAIAINRQWAQFFADHHFLLGVSIDGIEAVHDKYRISVNGSPTFERVMASLYGLFLLFYLEKYFLFPDKNNIHI